MFTLPGDALTLCSAAVRAAAMGRLHVGVSVAGRLLRHRDCRRRRIRVARRGWLRRTPCRCFSRSPPFAHSGGGDLLASGAAALAGGTPVRRAHRLAHRLVWPLLAVLVALGFSLALAWRPPPDPPVEAATSEIAK